MLRHVWPFCDELSQSNQSAFERGPDERALRVWLDRRSLRDDALLKVLRDFGSHPHIELEEVELRNICIGERDATLTIHGPMRLHELFFRWARNNLVALEPELAKLGELEPALEQRCVLAMFAWGHGCDALVTLSSQLVTIARARYPQANVMSSSEALAIVGLHLRLREDFVVVQQRDLRSTMAPSLFYDEIADALVPRLSSWYAEYPNPREPLAASAGGLVRAIRERLCRALRARDRMHGQLLRVPCPSTMDDALLYFETILVALSGAFDAVARTLHKAYGLEGRADQWRRADWSKQLTKKAACVGKLFAEASPSRDVIELVFVLRNLIHEEPPHLVGIAGGSGKLSACRFGVAAAEKAKLEPLLGRRHDASWWGAQELANGLMIDPGIYVERLLPAACSALNEIIGATSAHRERLQARTSDATSERERTTRLLLLAGLT